MIERLPGILSVFCDVVFEHSGCIMDVNITGPQPAKGGEHLFIKYVVIIMERANIDECR